MSGAPGWFSRLSAQLLNSVQVSILGHEVEPHIRLGSAGSLPLPLLLPCSLSFSPSLSNKYVFKKTYVNRVLGLKKIGKALKYNLFIEK